MGRFLFFIREAGRALRRSAAPSLAAIVTIGVTVLLLGVLIPVLYTTGSKAEEVREQIALRVFLYEDTTKQDVTKLEEEISAFDHVTAVEFVSKAEALEITRERLEDKDIVEELRGNPLPPSFTVNLDDPDNLEAVRSDLSPPGPKGEPRPFSPLIEEVVDSRQEANDIRAVTGDLKLVLVVLAVLLLIASLFLVANTIRLSIYARRREVEVMHLVGATGWFIRWPFMIEGMIVGFTGAVAAVAILGVGKVIILDPLSGFALIDNFETIDFLPLVIVLVGCAMLVSALGSGITLRRYLRV